jgi:hypothetical protein
MVRASSMNGKKLSLLAILGTAATFGCLVDDSTDAPATGGAGGTTGGTGGSAAGTGGSSAGSGGTAMAGSAGMAPVECMPNPTPLNCEGFVAPAWSDTTMPGTMINFTTYMADGKWGTSGQLTGGTSLYHGPSDVDLTRVVEAGNLHVTATITPQGYVGVVFWFAPCVDARSFNGINFSVGGTLAGAVLKAQIQTHVDYPVDVANKKGGCSFTNCDAKFSECAGPTYQVVVPATAESLDIPWTSFAGGTPTAEVTPDGLVGLQFQLECQSDTTCMVDLTLGNVSFTRAPVGN